MKKYLIAFCLAFMIFASFAQDSKKLTTLIVVRHAEKASDGSKDPGLTEQGQERAELLLKMVSSEVDAVFSTDYVRTRNTVAPIAKKNGLEVQIYDPRDKEAISKIIAANKGGLVIIAGHSNTVPGIVNQLIGEEKYAQLNDNEYDKLFVISVDSEGNGRELMMVF